MPEVPEEILRYLAARDADRERGVDRALASLTDRERALVRDAAVMGYVQGVQATHAKEAAIPGDSVIVRRVIAGCQVFDDLYPTISALGGAAEEADHA